MSLTDSNFNNISDTSLENIPTPVPISSLTITNDTKCNNEELRAILLEVVHKPLQNYIFHNYIF